MNYHILTRYALAFVGVTSQPTNNRNSPFYKGSEIWREKIPVDLTRSLSYSISRLVLRDCIRAIYKDED